MAIPTIDTQKLYTIIADTMPTEGRDFTIDVGYNGNNQPQLTVKPLTAVGRGFVPVLLERLASQMKGQNITIATDGVAVQELITVNVIRERVAQDSMAKLQTALRDTKEQYRKSTDEMAKMDKVRSGKTLTAEERKKRGEVMRHMQQLTERRKQLEFMIARIPEIKEQVNGDARAAAEADAKNGKNWATDLNAPLTSLFDRQDVTEKLQRQESLIQQIAAYTFMTESARNNAIAVGKQYILQK